MQRQIGEVFDYTLETGEFVILKAEKETNRCDGCFFEKSRICGDDDVSANIIGDCEENNVVFVQTEKHNSPEADKKKQQKAKKILLDLAQEPDPDEPDTFNSQREIWQYLSESEENKVCRENGDIFSFYKGVLYIKNKTQFCPVAGCEFNHFNQWKKYTPPKTITVNGVEIEAPLRSLYGVDVVYVPCFSSDRKYDYFERSGEYAKNALNNNMAFATPEAAIACHDAILKGIIISH